MSITREIEHDLPSGIEFPAPPPPLTPAEPAKGRTAAEEARTLVANNTVGSLATISDDGHPWASLVTYGSLADGSPVLLLSTLAEHGRNLERDPRASLMVAARGVDREPLAHGRVTLAGRAERPDGDLVRAAQEAHLDAVPTAAAYAGFNDFSLWVLRVERVRWVGGYGRMDSTDMESYAAAEPDPTAPSAAAAIAHLNDDHPDALLAIAQALAGYPDATAATATAIDRYGLELKIETPRGRAPARVAYAEPAQAAHELRAATVELTKRARARLAEANGGGA